MKMGQVVRRSLGIGLLGLLLTGIETTGFAQGSQQVTLDTLSNTPQISPEAVPRSGNFYSLAHPEWPPFPSDIGLPVWQIGPDSYLMDDLTTSGTMAMSSDTSFPPLPGGGTPEDGTNGTAYTPPPDISNYAKYTTQAFFILNTNDVAANDTNLFNALIGFGDDTNTFPTLQISQYKPGILLIKASHFDYSSETRDFAIVVCDRIDTPLYKTFDLQNPSNNVQNGGWLLQGTVGQPIVTDPMFLMVSNISTAYNAFFRAIPYSGPQVTVAGYNTYDAVSNTISLQVDVTDLSGVTNANFSMDASGIPLRATFTGPDSVLIDTRYNLNSYENLNFSTTTKPIVWNSDDTPIDNPQLYYNGSSVLTLDFENSIFLAFASDIASLDIGQNDIDFYAEVPVTYSATITDLDSGRLLKAISGNATPGYILLLWNFTEQDGATPFTNDAYVVQFTATPSDSSSSFSNYASSNDGGDGGSGSTSLSFTNQIDDGVRQGQGCFISYQEENPSDPTGAFWNSSADSWLRYDLRTLYTDIYSAYGLTQYTTDQVGTNRNHANCVPLSSTVPLWTSFMPGNLSNPNYSDMTMGGVHCDGDTVGSSHAYLPDKFSSWDLIGWLGGPLPGAHSEKGWRLRKAAIWGCWSGVYDTGSLPFPSACGIRPSTQQMTSYCKKNAGFFFQGPAPQVWITGYSTITTAMAAEFLDEAFVSGANAYPGGCDPTYSFRWAVQATVDQYPEMNANPDTGVVGGAHPVGVGCQKLIYTTVYDDELTRLNFSHVKER
jgi:hypothetical protein